VHCKLSSSFILGSEKRFVALGDNDDRVRYTHKYIIVIIIITFVAVVVAVVVNIHLRFAIIIIIIIINFCEIVIRYYFFVLLLSLLALVNKYPEDARRLI